ncbi:MAG: universal stress protein [Nitriliruptorales bacterium]|nr:universal stress protein [Nitriliruptorales bacterium]
MSYKNVIVGTDGSPTASCAVEAAIVMAQATGAALHIATAWYPNLDDARGSQAVEVDHGEGPRFEPMWAAEIATDAVAVARRRGIEDARQYNPKGNPADVLIDMGESHEDSLIIVGTMGLTDRTERVLGNIPHSLTHHARSDALLCDTSDCSESYAWKSIALATDGSETAAVAVQHGIALAQQIGAEPTLLTVASDEAAGNKVLDSVPGSDGVARRIETGKPAEGLLSAAADFDMLVVGNKGMSGPSRLLGSVANTVTHHCPTDLLLVNTTR